MQSDELRWGQTPSIDFCSWEGQKGAFAVRLRLRVVKWLASHVMEARPSTGTPAELGGILLGRVYLENGKQIILIEGFVPVACNYGERWHLSDRDKWLFKEQLDRWPFGPDKKLYAVGFYRSRNPQDYGVGAPDLVLAREFFAEQAAVFLYVKQLPVETRVGGFVFRENRHVDQLHDLTFPFGEDTSPEGETLPPLRAGPAATELQSDVAAGPLGGNDTEPAQVPSFQEVAAAAVPEQSTAPPPSETPTERETWLQTPLALEQPGTRRFPEKWWQSAGALFGHLDWARVVFFGVLVLAMGSAAYWLFLRTEDPSAKGTSAIDKAASAIKKSRPLDWVAGTTASPPDSAQGSTTLDLEVVKEKDLLRLKWNKEVPLIASASSGILAVKDGSRSRDFLLDTARLQSGAFDYAHRTSDVTFRLRLKTPGGEASEWLRVRAERSPSSAPAKTAAFKPHSRGWAGPGSRRARDVMAARPRSTAPGGSTGPVAAKAEGVAEIAAHGLAPLSVVPQDTRSAGLERARPDGTPPEAKSLQSQAAGSSSPASPEVKTDESDRQAREKEADRLSPEPPDPLAQTEDTAEPEEPVPPSIEPRPVLRMTAYLSSGMRLLVPAGTRVVVKVYVDETGKVVRAEPMTNSNVNDNATRVAVRAASELRFSPPQRDGRNVASEMVIEFEFPDEMK